MLHKICYEPTSTRGILLSTDTGLNTFTDILAKIRYYILCISCISSLGINTIPSVPHDALAVYSGLSIFYIDRNKLTEVPNVSALAELRKLILATNNIVIVHRYQNQYDIPEYIIFLHTIITYNNYIFNIATKQTV